MIAKSIPPECKSKPPEGALKANGPGPCHRSMALVVEATTTGCSIGGSREQAAVGHRDGRNWVRAAARERPGLRRGVAGAARAGDHSVQRRQRRRHRAAPDLPSAVAQARPAGHRRESNRRRRHDRSRYGRQGDSRRLHAAGQLLVAHGDPVALSGHILRHAARLHRRDAARQPAHRAGGRAVARVQDAARPDRRRQGQARRDQLCVRRDRQRDPLCGRTTAAERGLRGRARAVPRRAGGLSRGDRRTGRFLLRRDRVGAPAHPGRQARGARGQHANARRGAARHADHARARVCGLGLHILDRHVRTPADAT